MEHFEEGSSSYDEQATSGDDPSFDGVSDQQYSEDAGFDIGIEDGEAVDLDGDGVADGTATVTYEDLDGDGQADFAEIVVHADTNGDGVNDAVVIIDQYDTDGDGLADTVEMTYGVDTDGDGQIDTSTYSSGDISSDLEDTDGDGEADMITRSVSWDADSEQSAEGDDEVVETSDGPYVVISDTEEDSGSGESPMSSAYVDPATGEWVEDSAG